MIVVLGVGFGRAGRAGWVGRGVGWGLAVLGALAGLGVVLGVLGALAGLGVVLGVLGWLRWGCWAWGLSVLGALAGLGVVSKYRSILWKYKSRLSK